MAKEENVRIKAVRTFLKNSVINNDTFVGYEKERNQIFNLVQGTVKFGESNSALLIGSRGLGKTKLVNDVLRNLQSDNTLANDFILVKLHGLLHTNDNLALKSTTSQMNLDNVVDGKVFGSFADNLAFLLGCLRTGDKRTSKSVVFILEEFDLFCAHHNQTLLYNLFDVCQSAQTPICVIGITCRLDVIELFEKRVKSRFSHRQVFLYPGPPDSNVSALNHGLGIIERYCKIPDNYKLINSSLRKQWNSDLKSLLGNKKFRTIIQRIVDIDNTETTLKNILINVVFDLREDSNLAVEQFQEKLDLLERDDTVLVLQDLNVLELCLIISMKHHIEIYDEQPMNFEMVLSRYMKFVNANSNMQTAQRPVIMKAFEHIQNLELISLVHNAGTRTQNEYQFFKLLVTPQQIMQAVKHSVGLPTEVVQWANSSLV